MTYSETVSWEAVLGRAEKDDGWLAAAFLGLPSAFILTVLICSKNVKPKC